MSSNQRQTTPLPSSDQPPPVNVELRLGRAWHADEFKPYESSRDSVLKTARTLAAPEMVVAYENHLQRLDATTRLAQAQADQVIGFALRAGIGSGFALVAAAIAALVRPVRDAVFGSFGPGAFVVPGLAVVLFVGSAIYFARLRRSKASRVQVAETEARYQWSREADAIARSAIRRALNDAQSGPGQLEFPKFAPDLVEREHESFVLTPAIVYVRRFVEEHSTSAIGVAGARGAGKSTLMRSVAELDGTRYVEVPAAGDYTPIELLRRIAFSIAAPDGLEPRQPYTSRSVSRMLSSLGGALLLYTGGFLIWLDFKDPNWADRVSGVSVAGLAVCVVGLFVGLVLPLRAVQRLRRRRAAESPADALALDLSYERSDEVSASAKLDISSFVGLEQSATRGRTTRELTFGDLVQRLRAVLQHEATVNKRVVVALDELDKIATVGSLANAVNAIKDLFRIDGVHFLVSVSDEALRSFQARGLRERDAFDSSFDIVRRVDRMPIQDGRQLLGNRVTGFPDELAVLCTVWTGGLARDVIRLARECIDVQRDDGPLETWDLASAVLEHNVRTREEASDPGALDLAFKLDLAKMLQTDLTTDVTKTVLAHKDVALVTAFTLLAKRALELVKEANEASLRPGGSQYVRLEELSRRVALLSRPTNEPGDLAINLVEYVGQTLSPQAGLLG